MFTSNRQRLPLPQFRQPRCAFRECNRGLYLRFEGLCQLRPSLAHRPQMFFPCSPPARARRWNPNRDRSHQKAKDEFSDELHKAGKSETETANADVKPAQSTVPRSQGESAASVTPPQSNEAVTAGNKADQV